MWRNSTTGTKVQRYTPFGHIRDYANQHNQPTDRTYTSQLNDHNGLYHYNARYYDYTLSQFTQPDTWTPDPTLSTDWNRYTYVRNNPLTYTDPTGHCPSNYNCGGGDYYDSAKGGSNAGGAKRGRGSSGGRRAPDQTGIPGKTRQAAESGDPLAYIVDEMNRNSAGNLDLLGTGFDAMLDASTEPVWRAILERTRFGLGLTADTWRGIQFRPGGDLDHKPEIVYLWGSEQQLTIAGEEWRIPADMWSNIHYGYVVEKTGGPIPNSVWMACARQCPGVGEDNPLDSQYMEFGASLARETTGAITPMQLERALTQPGGLHDWARVNDRTRPERVGP